jgi:hypothetical protein
VQLAPRRSLPVSSSCLFPVRLSDSMSSSRPRNVGQTHVDHAMAAGALFRRFLRTAHHSGLNFPGHQSAACCWTRRENILSRLWAGWVCSRAVACRSESDKFTSALVVTGLSCSAFSCLAGRAMALLDCHTRGCGAKVLLSLTLLQHACIWLSACLAFSIHV